MHLRTLTLRAIGPFAAEHTIDFDAVGASGLFLLEGPTGSGKSTIIDAIVFALYGKVASADASDDRLRSAYAADDVESVVDLVFETASGLYRVRRTPAFQRAKKRGTGTTTAQASVKAWRLPPDASVHAGPAALDAVGVPLGNRLDEVGAELQRAVGLDRAQFVQTIVLPQGEFARFLRSDPDKERRVLLQKIFGTEVYERLQVRLAELRAESARAVDAARVRLTEAAAGLVGAARLDAEHGAQVRDALDAATVPGADVVLLRTGVGTVVDGVVDGLAAAAAEQRALAEQSGRVREAAQRTLDVATATAALVERRDRLRAERSDLLARADEHAADVARLAAGRAALVVRPLLTAADEARTVAQAAAKAFDAALDAAPADLVAEVRPDGSGPAHTEADDSLRERFEAAHRQSVVDAAALERAVRVEEGLEAARRSLRDGLDGLDDLDAALAAHDAWLAARPAARAAVVAALDEARAAAARLGEREGAARAAAVLLDDVRSLAAACTESDEAQGTRAAAAVTALQAVERERDLRRARIAGLAGELAAGLSDGEPCPVCGAAEHPAPATLGAGHVSGEHVEEAERARAAAEGALAGLTSRVEVLAERVSTLAGRVGDATVESATAGLAAAQAEVDGCRAQVAEVARLEPSLQRFDEETDDRRASRGAVERQRAERAAALDAERALLDVAEAEVVVAREDHPTVAARYAGLQGRIETTGDLVDALADLQHTTLAASVRAAELDAGLVEAGFVSRGVGTDGGGTGLVGSRSLDAGSVESRSAESGSVESRSVGLTGAGSAGAGSAGAGLVEPRVPDAAAAREAMLEPDKLAALAHQVSDHASALDRTAVGLAEADVAALPDDVLVDLPGARAAEADARTRADAAAGAAQVASDRALAAVSAGDHVRTAADALAARLREAAPVTRMAGLAAGTGGDNGKGLSLATFVLMRRFEDVVAAANERLRVMSDGRYELERSDEKEDVRSRNTGLAMRVLDHHTEQARDPRTLSGGETFYVSLCLALGMADVVTAESGGVDLGTLFVDEGFGSLDPHTLDQVLAELGRLRAGGRTVGVVSHVDALKQSIADRIEVRPTSEGPSTLVVRAG